ncbi:hypothetical protein CPAR01_13415 [Colletotrichum paranaense]|uniref:Uncharacterized protein n=1 Tax=Colletotrichum paranaense TaxID=1914294 RepID=A0ABQ9S5X1_9PEZI|nr:uncharacterized protein CPAR01_13415 [Colletotrichum paranaense]KAK1526887.1 hypothetical protein CPAR01_13415 [Colletotrichum paranaense]
MAQEGYDRRTLDVASLSQEPPRPPKLCPSPLPKTFTTSPQVSQERPRRPRPAIKKDKKNQEILPESLSPSGEMHTISAAFKRGAEAIRASRLFNIRGGSWVLRVRQRVLMLSPTHQCSPALLRRPTPVCPFSPLSPPARLSNSYQPD